MNKPKNERIDQSHELGTQLRYISRRRLRKLRSRHRRQGITFFWRACEFAHFYSWLRPV
jgi:hypothetical protein